MNIRIKIAKCFFEIFNVDLILGQDLERKIKKIIKQKIEARQLIVDKIQTLELKINFKIKKNNTNNIAYNKFLLNFIY